MPVMDGLEATRRIRALEGGHGVKIVALSASVFSDERAALLAAGADDFVAKPFQPEHILECMARQLGAQLVHQDGAEAAPETAEPLSSEALAALPGQLRQELVDAVVSLDVARIAGVIRRVAVLDPVLGEVLARHAGGLEYTAIVKAVQAGTDDRDWMAP